MSTERKQEKPRKVAKKTVRHFHTIERKTGKLGMLEKFVARPRDSLYEKLYLRIAAPDGNQLAIIGNLRSGLAFHTIDALAEAYDASRKDIALVLSIPVSTLSRRKKEGRLQPDESDRVARLARLKDAAVEMMNGDNDAAVQWLKTPLHILNDESPLTHASSEIGAREVEDLIIRIQHGVFS
ncbi:MAG: DUF2384 domain-containing protein [Gammaproteobacteria bacterium]|nr:DUF2384 domain-containing protein [Gammaproteobacteria bacterium]